MVQIYLEPPPQKPLAVTRQVAARLLGRSVVTLERWAREGRGPRVTRERRPSGRNTVCYAVKDLEEYLSRNAAEAGTAEKAETTAA